MKLKYTTTTFEVNHDQGDLTEEELKSPVKVKCGIFVSSSISAESGNYVETYTSFVLFFWVNAHKNWGRLLKVTQSKGKIQKSSTYYGYSYDSKKGLPEWMQRLILF